MNIMLIEDTFNWDQYIKFMKSLDCYLLLSKGEGFSVTPREAMALGVPCIISDNTAHTTICNSGWVRKVPALIAQPAYYEVFKKNVGYHFDCYQTDIVDALLDVYNNYSLYLTRAKEGKKWVAQYTHENVHKLYFNLIKPSNIILGKRNQITADYFMTNSKNLYNKYKALKNL